MADVQPAGSGVELAPLTVDPDTVAWDAEGDVVVVGFGGTGACAALEAHAAGASVILVDRFRGGGATAYSGGVIYAGGTRFQHSAGVDDSAEEMRKYLELEVGDAITPETLREYCEGSSEMIDWLTAHGVQFGDKVWKSKASYPPEDCTIYYSGNEKVPGYREKAKPAPRGHRTAGSGFTGYAYFAALRAAVERTSVRIMPHAAVRRLLQDGSGRIVGVELAEIPEPLRQQHDAIYDKLIPDRPYKYRRAAVAEAEAFERQHAVTRRVRARGGVVLATGGFANNAEMVRQYYPAIAPHEGELIHLGSIGCDGSGIRLGEGAGGATRFMENPFLTRSIAPPVPFVKGIVVNRDGERFINEDTYGGFLGAAIARQPEGDAWLIIDSAHLWQAVRECMVLDKQLLMTFCIPTIANLLFGGTRRAGTIEKLAGKLGMDGATLRRTVDDYNRGAAAGEDRFHKAPENMVPFPAKGPFYAVNSRLNNMLSFMMLFTLGGLTVDERSSEVLRADGSPVKGLYAAGRAAVGICSVGYLSGMSLGDCVFSGRRAGRHAAAEASATAFGVAAE